MCQIIACVKARAPMEILERAIQGNKDGTGACWIEGRKVRWVKGLSIADASRYLETLPMPFALHFRMATAGAACTPLTHPFTMDRVPDRGMTGAARSVLMHNGHVSDWQLLANVAGIDLNKHGPWSDSRVVAAITSMRGYGILKHLDGSRWLVMDREGPKFFGAWIEREGWAISSPSYCFSQGYFDQDCYVETSPDGAIRVSQQIGGRAWPGGRGEDHVYNRKTKRWELWSRR